MDRLVPQCVKDIYSKSEYRATFLFPEHRLGVITNIFFAFAPVVYKVGEYIYRNFSGSIAPNSFTITNEIEILALIKEGKGEENPFCASFQKAITKLGTQENENLWLQLIVAMRNKAFIFNKEIDIPTIIKRAPKTLHAYLLKQVGLLALTEEDHGNAKLFLNQAIDQEIKKIDQLDDDKIETKLQQLFEKYDEYNAFSQKECTPENERKKIELQMKAFEPVIDLIENGYNRANLVEYFESKQNINQRGIYFGRLIKVVLDLNLAPFLEKAFEVSRKIATPDSETLNEKFQNYLKIVDLCIENSINIDDILKEIFSDLSQNCGYIAKPLCSSTRFLCTAF